jgi:cytochrome d ubiquinol oxidase subunit I
VNALDLARWQFGITTVYHFFFVPITIGMIWLIAGFQTAWYRTGKDQYLRATKFWGKLFLINFAMGVVTGIVQEFQFGMNWSEYSRFVGDIFGAPLAMEGLMAFFLESTFVGLWVFGWDRLPKKVHLATVWLTAFGTTLSAYFILAANAFMQHPTGYRVPVGYTPATPPAPGVRATLTNIVEVLTQKTAVIAFAHTIAAALLVAGGFMLGVSIWHLVRRQHEDVMRPSLKVAGLTAVLAMGAVTVTGHIDAQIMTQQQPMKMAAAEALWDTQSNAGFSLFTWGTLNGDKEVFSIRIPGLTSLLATNSVNGTVEGINDVNARLVQLYGPGSYKPNIPVTYWSFRLMIGGGAILALFALISLWLFRGGRSVDKRWYGRLAVVMIFAPLMATTFGWIFTEMGRQPWVVYGLLLVANGVSIAVHSGEVWVSMIVFTLLYGVLAVVEVWLMARYAKAGPPAITTEQADADYERRGDPDRPLTFAY